MTNASRFGWGCIGASASEVLRLYKLATVDVTSPHPSFGLFYFAAVLAMLLLGGCWSVVLESDKKFLAFYHGATAPIVISALLR